MTNKQNFTILLISLLLCSDLYAQDQVVRGIVTIFDSIPLIGVNIKAKNTKQIVFTDSLGRFSIGCKLPDVLNVSANGFYNQKAKLPGRTKFAAVNLKLKPVSKSQEYNIGYGHIPEKDKMNAISKIDETNIDFSQYKNVYDIITGRFSGVAVENGKIQIRGQKSFLLTNEPLILVDGFTVDANSLESMPTSQIKSINVIKDGGAAIYGARGANGVVLIETKK
jgi:TonB-dependent SusC/RagA subfamily outer membrane receptor